MSQWPTINSVPLVRKGIVVAAAWARGRINVPTFLKYVLGLFIFLISMLLLQSRPLTIEGNKIMPAIELIFSEQCN